MFLSGGSGLVALKGALITSSLVRWKGLPDGKVKIFSKYSYTETNTDVFRWLKYVLLFSVHSSTSFSFRVGIHDGEMSVKTGSGRPTQS